MKNAMQGIVWMLVYGVSQAYAAPGSEGDGVSLLGYLFLGFFALIVVSQLVPAAMLFVGMLKGVLSARKGKAVELD
jgi:hypothetical protein